MTVVRRRDGKAIEGDTYFPPDWSLYFPPATLNPVESREVEDNPTYRLSFRLYQRRPAS